jgi:hypothetical protein
MKKILIGLLSTVAIGGAGAFAGATPASANPALLVVPWAIAAGVGGVAVGAAATAPTGRSVVVQTPVEPPAYPPPAYPPVAYASPDGAYAAAPDGACQYTRQWTANGWRTVTVCD